MKVISIINLKGGTAKTFTAITMSQILAIRHNKRVLLIDNDPQGNSSQYFNRYYSDEASGISCLLRGILEIQYTDIKGLDIITANLEMINAIAELPALSTDSIYKFNNTLQGISKDYDYCIIDNPPSLAINVLNALVITDDVIITLEPSVWSLDGLENLIGQIDNIKPINPFLSLIGCLMTRYKNTEDAKAGESWLRSQLKHLVFETKIRHSNKVEKSIREQKPIFQVSRRCAAAVDYIRFVEEYLQKED